MSEARLVARDVHVKIGDTPILHGASMTVHEGELLAVVGPNGAGKSTFSRAVGGLQPMESGDVRWSGHPIGELKGRKIAKLRAFVPQRAPVPAGVTERVQIAVGLAQEAPVLIADEPTSHLDLGATAGVARLLRRLADDGLSVILVVHDLALAAAIADTVVVMAAGKTHATGTPADVLTPERLSEVWRVDAALDDRGALHVNWLGR
jgi:iron complex transport system ATP-binding protein